MASDIRAILAPLHPPGDEAVLLSWADRLARDFEARVDAAYVREDWKQSPGRLSDFNFYLSDSILDELEQTARDMESKARDAFEEAAEHAPAGRFGRFIQVAEQFRAGVAHATRCCDLALAVLPGQPFVPAREDVIEATLVGGGAPLLALPAERPADAPLATVMVAWNAARESARALRVAVPFLRRAANVHVVRFGDEGADQAVVSDAVDYLAAHRIEVETAQRDLRDATPGEAILAHAQGVGADLFVMGAFGRARWIEQAVHGVTRHVLTHAACPVLLAH